MDPPPTYLTACKNWAAGSATPYETAAITAVSTGAPLPAAYDPNALLFDPSTRLPPRHALDLYLAAKDAARAEFHAESSRAARDATLSALASGAPLTAPVLPTGLGAWPARAGLARAAGDAIGKTGCAQWIVCEGAVVAAGVEFAKCVRAVEWEAEVDEEGGVCVCTAGAKVSDKALAKLAVRMARGLDRDVLPAGAAGVSDNPRIPVARSGWLGRALWRAVVFVGMRGRRVNFGRVEKYATRRR